MSGVNVEDRFAGCLLGLAIADGLGSPVEGMAADMIYQFFGGPKQLCVVPPDRLLHYTDDTQMMIGVAQSLIDQGRIVESDLVARFVANLDPARGYGAGALRILQAMADGRDWRSLAACMFPGGSYGNGAAMRVAPVGLLFHDDLNRAWDEARLSSLPTHVHPLAIEGAQLLAVAVGWLLRQANPCERHFDRASFYRELQSRARTDEFQWLLRTAEQLHPQDSVSVLGNGIEAHRSVVTAIACFTDNTEDFRDAVGMAISLGGDTDTIAAMTGALFGAYQGLSRIPRELADRLENGKQGRDAILALAFDLSRRAAC